MPPDTDKRLLLQQLRLDPDNRDAPAVSLRAWVIGAVVVVVILAIAAGVAKLEPYGLAILIGLLIILPMLGAQLGVDLSFLSHLIAIAANAVIGAIVQVTGNG